MSALVGVFREVKRVLRDTGTLWLDLGDSYAGAPVGSFNGGGFKDNSAATGGRDLSGVAQSGRIDKLAASGLKPKDLIGVPWRVAFALQADGWFLRSDIVWSKPNPMPESVTDRPTKAHEYVFLLSKSGRYYYDAGAIAERSVHAGRVVAYDGTQKSCVAGDAVNDRRTLIRGTRTVAETRNRRSVWTIAAQPFEGAHFAVMPEALVAPCILAGCPPGGVVLDPFFGTGTVGVVALRLDRAFVGIELNPEYVEMAERRLAPVRAQGRLFAVRASSEEATRP